MARLSNERVLTAVERSLLRRGFLPATVRQVLATARSFSAVSSIIGATTHDVRRFLAAGASKWAANTHSAYLYRLRLLFGVLVAEGKIAADPTEPLRLVTPAPRPHLLLVDDHFRRLLVAASQPGKGLEVEATALRDRATLELLYGLGLRSAEVRAALVVDLDLRQGTLFVRRAKGGQPEHLPLPPAALVHVAAWLRHGRPQLARGDDQGVLLVRNDGKPLHRTAVGKIVDKAKVRAGVDRAHPHAFRRATATSLAKAGTPLPIVQRLLGHQRLTTTAVYVEVEREDLRRAVDLLDAARERERACEPALNQRTPNEASVRVRRRRGARAR